MKTLTLLVGPPGSGKSTYAHKLINEDGDGGLATIRISQDDQGAEHLDNFHNAIVVGNDVIVDRMNFNKEQRSRYLKPAKELGYRTKIVVLHVPRETCLNRCNSREDHPTIKDSKTASKAVNMFFSKYERVEDSEADQVVRDFGELEKRKAIICDLDGTLCNIDHRLEFVKAKNWKDFFYNIPGDSVNEWCATILAEFNDTDIYVVLASGRPDDHQKPTIEWLAQNSIDYNALFMRQRGDFRQDYIVKEIILEFELKTRYEILFTIDDRDQVVTMWRKHGITCLQCANGDF